MSSIATTNETSNVTSLPPAPKPQPSKEVIAANVKLLIEQLEQGHSEGLTAYLTAMGRFHNYSFGNILEIARQKPDATSVAGLYAWNQLKLRCRTVERMNACENILRLSLELGVHRRLLYKWRDQVDPADAEAEGDVVLQNPRESALRK